MANRYWVGGTGTWDASNTTNWSTASGGAGGASVPTTADAVILDGSSGTGTITLGLNVVCLTFNVVNYTGSINFNSYSVNISGNAATVFSGGGGFTLIGTPILNFTYAGATGTRVMSSGPNVEATLFKYNITAGTDTVTISNAKSINFSGFSGTLSNTTRTLYGDLILTAGMTVNAGTGVTTFAATSGTQKITTAGKALDFPITQNSPGAIVQLQDNLTMGSTRTFTLTAGTLDLTGNSGNWTLSTGLFSSSNSNTRAIAFGTGSIVLTTNSNTCWSTNNATNFSYTGTSNIIANYAGSTGTRSFFHGGAAGGSENNALNLSITAGSDTLSIGNPFYAKNLTFTGFSGSLNNAARFIFGNLTVPVGMTLTAGASATTFSATSGAQQITTNNVTVDFPLIFDGVGGTFAFQNALTQGSTRAFTIINGTVKLKNGVTSTVGTFVTSGTNQKYLQSTTAGSQATLSQASGTVGTSYLTIQDIYATGGATWNSFYANNNVDAGNNTNWNFGGTPSYDAEYGYKLRSFTERGRF